MFIQNKYTKTYYNIIKSAQSNPYDGYTEKHHIIPKSLSGSNDLSNLVVLSARQHFVCHWLLTKMVESKKHKWQMWNAFSCMLWRDNNGNRYKINARLFQQLKEQHSKHKSWALSGNRNPMWNKDHTPEAKEKIRKIHTGRVKSDQECKNISAALKGKPRPYASDILKKTNPNDVKVSCIFCKNETSRPIFSRSHGDKCRKNPNNPDREKYYKTTTCDYCGITFEYKLKDKSGKYCSNKCCVDSGYRKANSKKGWERRRINTSNKGEVFCQDSVYGVLANIA